MGGFTLKISLIKSGLDQASLIHEMQVKSFEPLLNKYQDYETSPANETIDRIISRMNQSVTNYYLIRNLDVYVGAIRIVRENDFVYRVSPIFILPEHQGKGIAQQVFAIIEEMHKDARMWELDTILQEQGNCYLYEKLGYERTGKVRIINDKMSIVFYEKQLY